MQVLYWMDYLTYRQNKIYLLIKNIFSEKYGTIALKVEIQHMENEPGYFYHCRLLIKSLDLSYAIIYNWSNLRII